MCILNCTCVHTHCDLGSDPVLFAPDSECLTPQSTPEERSVFFNFGAAGQMNDGVCEIMDATRVTGRSTVIGPA